MLVARSPSQTLPTYVYIDAGYITEQLKKTGHRTDFDPRHIASFIERQQRSYWRYELLRLYYYDATLDESDPDFIAQQSRLATLQSLPFVFVRTGWVTGRRRRQKAVDVQLAVDALEAARNGVIRAIALMAGDADFTPLAEAVHRAGTQVVVAAWPDSLSQDLANAADVVISLRDPDHMGNYALEPSG